MEELTLEVGITSVSRFCHMGIIQKRLLPRQLVEAWKTLETQTQLQKWNSLNLTTLTQWFDSSFFLQLRIIEQNMRLFYKEGSLCCLLLTYNLKAASTCIGSSEQDRVHWCIFPDVFSPHCTGEIRIKPSTFANAQWSTGTWKRDVTFTTFRFPLVSRKEKENHWDQEEEKINKCCHQLQEKGFFLNNNKKCL